MNEAFEPSLEFARKLDQKDPLADFRTQFLFPKTSSGANQIYFLGNSLGLQPKTAKVAVLEALEDWERYGVDGHFSGRRPWLSYNELLSQPLANLVGGEPSEVIAMNSLSINLHLMMASFYRPTRDRFKILIEENAFPSDRYAVDSQIRLHGRDPREALILLKPRPGDSLIASEDFEVLLEKYGHEIALVLLPGVQYFTGQVLPIDRLTQVAKKRGCKVGWDLAHSIGNVEMRLHDWNVDFAVWCSYKYLNSGPAATGGCFVHSSYARDVEMPRLAGWWGNEKESRFLMRPEFVPAPGAAGWQVSNSPIFSMAPLRASLEIFEKAKMPNLRQKSLQLVDFLIFLLKEKVSQKIEVITPRDPEQRGCQISFRGLNRSNHKTLVERGVACDWREPDAIRVAPVPLYNSFEDVYRFYEILLEVAKS